MRVNHSIPSLLFWHCQTAHPIFFPIPSRRRLQVLLSLHDLKSGPAETAAYHEDAKDTQDM
jgi:hypothetical protein